MHHEQEEILRHSIIGAMIAVALAFFHQVAESFAHDWIGSQGSFFRAAIQVTGWMLLFGAVFITIFIAEHWIRWLQSSSRVRLDEVGFVDGPWITATVLDGTIFAGSVFEISSSVGEGFRMNGVVYRLRSGTLDREVFGHWRTVHAGVHVNRREIAYVYEGDTNGQDRLGAGFYRFTADRVTEGGIRIEGSFLSRQDGITRHVIGRRVGKALSPKEVLAVLAEYLSSEDVIRFANTKSPEISRASST